ncbi:hypothetical protein ACFL09_06470 [Planctomycetota bacterium]
MRMRASSPTVLALVASVSVVICGGPPAARAKVMSSTVPPRERVELARIRAQLGYVAWQDGRVIFRKPYQRNMLAKVLAKVSDRELVPAGRVAYLRLLSSLVKFWAIPEGHLKELVRPAVAKAVDELGEPRQEDRSLKRLATEADRCLWNVDYALATAEFERLKKEGEDWSNAPARSEMQELEKQAAARTKTARVGYVGDLVSWYLRADLETATAKISQFGKVHRRNWRVHLAGEELRLRRQLKKCKDDEQRASVLIRASADPDNPIPLQGWAVRTLSKYPTEAAIKFLFELYRTARQKKRDDLGLEAQEALRRLKKIPESEHRYRVM